MTIEEAKEVFLNRGFVNGYFDSDKWRASIVVISKWLQQEPCDDCISRKAMLEPYKTLDDNDTICIWLLRKNIEQQSSVTPQQKIGKWIFTKTIFDKYGCTVECSSCHKKWKTYDEIRWKKENKFCHNCGAKMEESE